MTLRRRAVRIGLNQGSVGLTRPHPGPAFRGSRGMPVGKRSWAARMIKGLVETCHCRILGRSRQRNDGIEAVATSRSAGLIAVVALAELLVATAPTPGRSGTRTGETVVGTTIITDARGLEPATSPGDLPGIGSVLDVVREQRSGSPNQSTEVFAVSVSSNLLEYRDVLLHDQSADHPEPGGRRGSAHRCHDPPERHHALAVPAMAGKVTSPALRRNSAPAYMGAQACPSSTSFSVGMPTWRRGVREHRTGAPYLIDLPHGTWSVAAYYRNFGNTHVFSGTPVKFTAVKIDPDHQCDHRLPGHLTPGRPIVPGCDTLRREGPSGTRCPVSVTAVAVQFPRVATRWMRLGITLTAIALPSVACGRSTTAATTPIPIPSGWRSETYGEAAIAVPRAWAVKRGTNCPDARAPGTLLLGLPGVPSHCPEIPSPKGVVTVWPISSETSTTNVPTEHEPVTINGVPVYVGPGSPTTRYWIVPALAIQIAGSRTGVQSGDAHTAQGVDPLGRTRCRRASGIPLPATAATGRTEVKVRRRCETSRSA